MNDFELYLQIRKIQTLVYDYARPEVLDPRKDLDWIDDCSGENINAFYNITKQGVFFEEYYGIPGKLWTPWGTWGCWGSGSGNGVTHWMKDLLKRLGATLYKPRWGDDYGSYGPIYAVNSVDGVSLPKPELLYSFESKGCENRTSAWVELATRNRDFVWGVPHLDQYKPPRYMTPREMWDKGVTGCKWVLNPEKITDGYLYVGEDDSKICEKLNVSQETLESILSSLRIDTFFTERGKVKVPGRLQIFPQFFNLETKTRIVQ